MSIRAFLYSRKADRTSAQTQWPSAILLIDNDPDRSRLPVCQTPNKAIHCVSSANNLHTAAGVTSRPASSECETVNKAPSRQEAAESILCIDPRLCAAATDDYILVLHLQKTHRTKGELQKKEKQTHKQCKTFHDQSFRQTHLAGDWYTCRITHQHTRVWRWHFSRDDRKTHFSFLNWYRKFQALSSPAATSPGECWLIVL